MAFILLDSVNYEERATHVTDLNSGRSTRPAFSLAESPERALYWFRNHPIRDFDYKTPEVLVSEGKADAVIRYIQSLSAGASG